MPADHFDTPVLFLIFNRPELTFQVFDQIKKVRPRHLFIAADGPRADHAADPIKCAETRKIVDWIDWDCEVHTLFRDDNLGCGRGVSEAITWFFEHVEEGIILEDDCLPDLSFFRFCEEMLDRYRKEPRVWQISGCNVLNTFDSYHNESYYYSRFGIIWGWATWRDRWSRFEYNLIEYQFQRNQVNINSKYNHIKGEKFEARILDELKNKLVDSWANRWGLIRIINEGICIVPHKNLVSNIGFGDDSTHTNNINDQRSKFKRKEIDFPLVYPTNVATNSILDKKYFETFCIPSTREKIRSKIQRLALSLKSRFNNLYLNIGLGSKSWGEIEKFDPDWKIRIRFMSQFIEPNSMVLDLGSGPEWLKEYLPKNCTYKAVDYKKRTEHTIVCDFNKYEFPNVNVDVSFISGCLEYIEDYDWFINKICTSSRFSILSYNSVDSDKKKTNHRRSLGWLNHLHENEIVEVYRRNGFSLKGEISYILSNSIFVFEKSKYLRA